MPSASAEIDVVLRLEVKLRLRTPATNLGVRRLICTNRNCRVRNVRQRRKNLVHALFGLGAQLVELGDAILQSADFSTTRFGLFFPAFLHQAADFTTRRVALCIELIRFSNRAPPVFIRARKIVERARVEAARLSASRTLSIFSLT